MPRPKTNVEKRSFSDIVLDTSYGYFEPLRVIIRSFFTRHYRVTWHIDSGMTWLKYTETFTAYHDRAAWRKAKNITGQDCFELEEYRPIKKRRPKRSEAP